MKIKTIKIMIQIQKSNKDQFIMILMIDIIYFTS